MLYNYLILLCLLFMQPLFGFQLKERLDRAQPGDFIVYAYKSSFTLLRVSTITNETMTFEEIAAALTEKPTNWKVWLEGGAKGHTSWTITVVNRKDFTNIQTTSKDDAALYKQTLILPKLFTLELTPIADSERKKRGPEPLTGEIDHRSIWSPKIIFNDKEVQAPVSGYILVWPKDESELSGRRIEMYVPDDHALTYFPYWIEVLSGPLKFKVFAIDSGKNLVL